MNKILIFFIFLSTTACLCSQNLSGYIRNENLEAVEYAYVIVELGEKTIQTYSNADGYYSLNSVPAHSPILIKCMGYEDYNSIAPTNGKLNIRLEEKNHYINTIVVTGTRTERTLKDTPVLTKVITSEELHKSGSITALDALNSILPGVHFNPNPMGDNLQIQGLSNNYVLILIDGERLVPERRENVNFSRINSSDIERIEIINGSASALYGSNAIGSVINFITKKNKKKMDASAQVRYSKYQTLTNDLSVGFKHKKFKSKTSFNYKRSDGYDLTPETPRTYTLDPSYDFSIGQSFAADINEKLGLEIRGNYYKREIKNPPLSSLVTHYMYQNYTAGGKLNYQATASHLLSGSLFSDMFIQDNVLELRNNEKRRRSNNSNSSFRITDTWQLNENLNFISGFENNLEYLYSTVLLGPEPASKNSVDNNIFSQANFKFFKQFETVLGLRFTHHSGFGSHLSPSLSLMYKLNDIRVRGSFNHGFKAPTVKEMYYNFDMAGISDVIGNPNLRPETSFYKSLSFEYLKNDINFSTTLFHNQIKNKINTVFREVTKEGTERNEIHHENVLGARILGVDANIQWRFLKHFQMKAAYIYADAIDLNSKEQISGNSKHNLTSSMTFNYSKLKIKNTKLPIALTLLGQYASGRIFEKAGTESSGEPAITYGTSKPFSLFSLIYTQEIPIKTVKAELQVGLKNIFDRTDKMGFSSIDQGRRVELMTRFSF